jgi:hypothetical protein
MLRKMRSIVAGASPSRHAQDELLVKLGYFAAQLSLLGPEKRRQLWDWEFRLFSQWGEDGILLYLCDKLQIARPKILEFGAGNFRECNSRLLAEIRNALVTAVDSSKDLRHGVEGMDISWRTGIWPVETWVSTSNAAQIMIDAKKQMRGIDIISIDLDGIDFWVAQSLDYSEVEVVVVEYNALFGFKESISVPNSESFERTTAHFSNLYYGASLSSFITLFDDRGFQFVGTNRACNNAFFVKRRNANKLEIELPDESRLDLYTDWRVRESRDAHGKLTYASTENGISEILDLPVVDLARNEVRLLRDVDLI